MTPDFLFYDLLFLYLREMTRKFNIFVTINDCF